VYNLNRFKQVNLFFHQKKKKVQISFKLPLMIQLAQDEQKRIIKK